MMTLSDAVTDARERIHSDRAFRLFYELLAGRGTIMRVRFPSVKERIAFIHSAAE